MLMLALMAAVALPAIWTDTRTQRIPNPLVAATLALGLAWQVWSHGAAGSLLALAGAAIGMLLLLPFYMSGAMGAGDVKFMAAFGTWLGPVGAAAACVFMLVAGSLLALATIGWRRMAQVADDTGAAVAPSARMPYAAAIAAGSLGAAAWIGQLN